MSRPLPEDKAKDICALFDSYCKTVLRNQSRNLKKQQERKSEREFPSEEPLKLFHDIIGRKDHKDIYPSEQLVIYTDKFSCVVYSETLYNALLSLPEKQRQVLMLDFWHDWKDKEIAKELEVSTRTVYNLRLRAFRAIRRFYEQQKKEK